MECRICCHHLQHKPRQVQPKPQASIFAGRAAGAPRAVSCRDIGIAKTKKAIFRSACSPRTSQGGLYVTCLHHHIKHCSDADVSSGLWLESLQGAQGGLSRVGRFRKNGEVPPIWARNFITALYPPQLIPSGRLFRLIKGEPKWGWYRRR